jgi:hypothetical protein
LILCTHVDSETMSGEFKWVQWNEQGALLAWEVSITCLS